MKEAKIGIEKHTDWLGTLKSFFSSSISVIDSESEFDKWKKENAKILAENDANISKLESELQYHDVKISKKKKEKEQIRDIKFSKEKVIEEQKTKSLEEKEHDDR